LDTAYIVDWLNLLGRGVHVVTGIAWIGASFYFIWIDNHLVVPSDDAARVKGVGGELWAVHGGGFYHSQKYQVAPPALPPNLHWFKWEAYSTWWSGMFLLALMYWYGAETYLLDRSVADLGVPLAVSLGVGVIVGGWVAYDLLCRSSLARFEKTFALVLFVAVCALAFGLCQLFSGRGAFIHFGAVLGTIMVANVFFVIIPGQRALISAMQAGTPPDPVHGMRGKQRSVHNTYFTLPVLFVMVSNHYSMTYGHPQNWLVLIAICLAGALIRVYFVARHKGRASPLPILMALAILLALIVALNPAAPNRVTAGVGTAQIRPIITQRCGVCHARRPTHPGFVQPPKGIVLDSLVDIERQAALIHKSAVVTKTMPLANLTSMTPGERDLVAAWFGTLQESRAQ
jgi:uncharacterized membrane protein